METVNSKGEKYVVEKPVKVKLKDGTEYEVTVVHPDKTDAFKAFWDAYLELCINQFEKELMKSSGN